VSFSDGIPRALRQFHIRSSTDHASVWFNDAGWDDPFEAKLQVVATNY
jgi:hypothetical protein